MQRTVSIVTRWRQQRFVAAGKTNKGMVDSSFYIKSKAPNKGRRKTFHDKAVLKNESVNESLQ